MLLRLSSMRKVISYEGAQDAKRLRETRSSEFFVKSLIFFDAKIIAIITRENSLYAGAKWANVQNYWIRVIIQSALKLCRHKLGV